MEEVIIIGIGGVTCGGKTTLATELKKLIPDSIILSQDDYCLDLKDPRHIWCKEVNHINFDVITGLDMEKMVGDIRAAVGNRTLLKMKSAKTEGELNGVSYEILRTAINDKLKQRQVHLIILDGFLLFAYQPLIPLVQLKYFFTLDREECLKRRNIRVYNPPDVPGYFEKCVWPEYLKHFEEVKATISDITYFSNTCENPLDIVLKDIFNMLQ